MSTSIIFDEIFEYRIIGKKTGGMGEVLILERISAPQEMDFIHKESLRIRYIEQEII